MKAWSYEARIARAAELANIQPAARELLNFYGELARLQQTVFDALQSSGCTDLDALLPHFPLLLQILRRSGTKLLADFGAERLQSKDDLRQLLIACWEGDAPGEPERFYARVLLQPYAEHLASRGQADWQSAAGLQPAPQSCPFCGKRPVAGVLRGEGEGAKRSLLCSFCSTEWPFRRVLCPNCGQEDKDRLPLYLSPEFQHVRVEACDVCKTYIKSIDLTKDGHAVPVVDELAAVALDLWAEEHGYVKMEPNLLGL